MTWDQKQRHLAKQVVRIPLPVTPSAFLCTKEGETAMRQWLYKDEVDVHVPMPPTPLYTRPIKLFGTQMRTFIANIKREMNQCMP